MLNEPGWWPTEEDIETARKVLTFALSEELNRLTPEVIHACNEGDQDKARARALQAERMRSRAEMTDASILRSWERYQKRRAAKMEAIDADD